MPMIEITTSSSTNVKARRLLRIFISVLSGWDRHPFSDVCQVQKTENQKQQMPP
jgi:hypothetical protein